MLEPEDSYWRICDRHEFDPPRMTSLSHPGGTAWSVRDPRPSRVSLTPKLSPCDARQGQTMTHSGSDMLTPTVLSTWTMADQLAGVIIACLWMFIETFRNDIRRSSQSLLRPLYAWRNPEQRCTQPGCTARLHSHVAQPCCSQPCLVASFKEPSSSAIRSFRV
jgi:hypothetical protein